MNAAIHDHTWENWTDDKKEAEERMETPILPESCQKMPMHAAQAQAVRRHQQERIRPGEMVRRTMDSAASVNLSSSFSGSPGTPWPRDWPTTGDSITTCRWEPASKARTTAPSTKRKLPPPLKVVGSPPHRYCSCAPYRKPCCLTCFIMLLAIQHSSGKSW